MKRFPMLNCLFFAMLALYTGGCANNELARKSDSAASPSSSQTQEAQKNFAGEQKIKSPEQLQDTNNTPLAQKSVTSASDLKSPGKGDIRSALENIYFSFDSFGLTPDARAVLLKNADLMKTASTDKVRIEGHCDERGSAEYNLALGERRALAAKKYLVTLGLPEDRLTTISYGEERPVDQGHDESAWVKNRRDEFVVIEK